MPISFKKTFPCLAKPVKFLSLQSVGKVTKLSPNYLTSFSSAQSEDQQCRNVRMKQKLFWSCFFWISLLLKLPSNAKKKLLQSIFWKSCVSLLGSIPVQTQPNWFLARPGNRATLGLLRTYFYYCRILAPCWSPLIFWNIHFGIYFKLG